MNKYDQAYRLRKAIADFLTKHPGRYAEEVCLGIGYSNICGIHKTLVQMEVRDEARSETIRRESRSGRVIPLRCFWVTGKPVMSSVEARDKVSQNVRKTMAEKRGDMREQKPKSLQLAPGHYRHVACTMPVNSGGQAVHSPRMGTCLEMSNL
jgi:hypothetical protein